MRDFESNLQALKLIRQSIRYVNYRRGVTGKLNADGSPHPDPTDGLPDGYLWVRLGGSRGATRVKALKTRRDAAGVDVIVAYNVETLEDEVLEVDPALALEKFGASAAAALNVPGVPAAMGGLVEAGKFLAGGLYADAERGGLYARIGACWHSGGYWDGSQAVMLTPTSSAGKKSFVCVGIDPRANAYVTTRTIDRDLAYPLPPDDCASVLAAQPTVFWAGAVELANGSTSIDPRAIIDLRFCRAPVMSGASPAMAGLPGLVPPPAANSHDRFLRGDGTWQVISGGGGGGHAIYPRRATLWHDESTVVSGNGLRHYLDPNAQLYNTRTNQDPAANGDSFTNGFLLAAGNYTLSVLGSTGAVFGRIDWYVDDALQISGQDWYSAATTRNVVKRAPISVAADGWHTLKGVVNGRHGSSTGYYITLTKLWITGEGE